MRRLWALFPALFALACSTSSTGATDGGADANAASDGATGGPVSGAADHHCAAADGGAVVQPVHAASCTADASASSDGGVVAYGDTLHNDEGDDDDCKYHLKWTAEPVRQGADVEFTVTVTLKSDGSPMRPLSGEDMSNLMPVRAEVYLNDTHPAPNTDQMAMEQSPGVYEVGAIRFDAPGDWTVRFHFHEMCSDALEDSPHGHAAFLVHVP